MTPDALWEAIADALAEVEEAPLGWVATRVGRDRLTVYHALWDMRWAGLVANLDIANRLHWRLA